QGAAWQAGGRLRPSRRHFPHGFPMTPLPCPRARGADRRAVARTATWLPATLILLLAGCASRQPADPSAANADAAAGARAPAAPARGQDRLEWRFADDGIRFDAHLPASRLSAVERIDAGVYRVESAPETHPINPSPWYGMRIHSDAPRAVELRF